MAKTNVEKLKDYLSGLKPGEKVQPAVLARKYKVNRRYIYTLLANEFPELETLGRSEAGKITQENLTKKRKTTSVKFPTPVGTLRSANSQTRDYIDVRWPSEKIKNEYIEDFMEKRSDVRGRKGLTNDEFAKKYFGKINTTTKSNVERINNVLQKQLGIEYEDAPEQEVYKKRLNRLGINVGKKAKYLHGTDAFPFHHIMPIGGEVDLTTNDVAVISKQMNSKLAPYNKKLNDISDAISNNFNNQSQGYLKRIDELNNNAEQIVAKATKELPKKFQPYIGFTKLDAITDEYGTPINLKQTRVGAVKEKGIPLRDLNTEQLSKLKNSIKSLSEKEKIAYCSILSRGGLPGDCAAAIDNDPVKAAQIFDEAPATSSAMTKVKNAALGFLKSPGVKRFTLAGAAGAAAQAIVKEFRNDDPTSYLSNEDQQKNMLVSMAMDPIAPDFERPDILDYQLPAAGASIAGATAISAPSTIKASRSRGLGVEQKGMMRTAGRVLGRGLGVAASPGLLAPLAAMDITSQIAEGDSAADIATDPLNYLYPAFADTTPKLTKGLPSAVRGIASLGMSPGALRVLSRAGILGFGASLGLQGMKLLQDD
tara:strand:- start:10 stop:1794 length:1785 start_codon:yes stop_codon:yes gene_type:complete